MLEPLFLHERIAPSAWAEKNLVFPRGTSPNAPGPFSLTRTPYMREPLDTITDPTVETVFLSWGAQCGKTALMLAAFGYIMAQQPGNGVWAMTSLEQVRDFSKKRVQEMVKANPCLARYLRPGDSTAFQPLNYQLMHMDVKFVGAGSPANMASTPAAWVFGDEAAKWPHVDKREAPPMKLLMDRTKAFPRRFHLFASTPTTVENEFWQQFLSCDMRQFFIPCPYCGGLFVFKFARENVRWDKPESGVTDIDLAAATVRYICPHCGQDIYEDQKPEMMARGVWRTSDELRVEYADQRIAPSSTARAYQLDSMYSPFLSWGKYVREFLEATQRLTVATDLQNLRNSWGALPYEFTRVTVKEAHIHELCGDHARGEVPGTPYYISVGYDPGGDATHWVACAVYDGGEMRVIDWGTLLQARSETHLENYGTEEDPDWRTEIDKPGIAPHFAGLEWDGRKPEIGFVDAGYMTGAIYDECMMLPGQLTPTKGMPTRVGTWNTRPAGPSWEGLSVVAYVDFFAKMSLYAESIARKHAPRLILPKAEDCDRDLLNGLKGQKLIEKGKGMEWRKVPDDHFGDCIKLSRVGWWVLGRRFEDADTIAAESPADADAPQDKGE